MSFRLIVLFFCAVLSICNSSWAWQANDVRVAGDLPIELDILVQGLAISNDERYVVAWGNTPELLEQNPRIAHINGGARDVRVVDLQERQVISKGTFPSTPNSVALIGDSVFVSLSRNRSRFDLAKADPALCRDEISKALIELFVYDRDSMQPRPKLRMPQIPDDLFVLPEGRLGVRSAPSGSTTFTVFDTREGTLAIEQEQSIHHQTTAVARRNKDQVEILETVYDLKKKQVVSLSSKPNFDPIAAEQDENFRANVMPAQGGLGRHRVFVPRKSRYPTQAKDWEHPYCFGRQIVVGRVYDERREFLYKIRPLRQEVGERTVLEFISSTQPVIHSVLLTPNKTTKRETCVLSTFRLLDGKEIEEKIEIFSVGLDRSRPPSSKIPAARSDSKIVVANRGMIFDYALEDLEMETEQHPFCLVWPEKQTLSADQVERFTVPYVGGKGEVNFYLETQIDGIEIDTITGEISVDTPKLWQRFVERNVETGRPDLEVTNLIEADGQPRDLNKKQKTTPSQVFQSLYGRSCGFDNEPTYLKLKVTASDGYGQISKLEFYITVLGRAETLSEARKEPDGNRAANDPKPVKPPIPVDVGKLNDLEERIQAIERETKDIVEQTKKILK